MDEDALLTRSRLAIKGPGFHSGPYAVERGHSLVGRIELLEVGDTRTELLSSNSLISPS